LRKRGNGARESVIILTPTLEKETFMSEVEKSSGKRNLIQFVKKAKKSAF
jgi:hypothetical protein